MIPARGPQTLYVFSLCSAIIALESSVALSSNAMVTTALEAGGTLALTMNNLMATGDGIIVLWDNNIDSFVGLLTTDTAIADNAQANPGNFTMTTLTRIEGVDNASTITSANLLQFYG